jgi:hypothetical protein
MPTQVLPTLRSLTAPPHVSMSPRTTPHRVNCHRHRTQITLRGEALHRAPGAPRVRGRVRPSLRSMLASDARTRPHRRDCSSGDHCSAAHPAALTKWPVCTRTRLEGSSIADMVQRSSRPARIDSYDNVAGSIAARVRAVGGPRDVAELCLAFEVHRRLM